jgi:hypothetical protein
MIRLLWFKTFIASKEISVNNISSSKKKLKLICLFDRKGMALQWKKKIKEVLKNEI